MRRLDVGWRVGRQVCQEVVPVGALESVLPDHLSRGDRQQCQDAGCGGQFALVPRGDVPQIQQMGESISRGRGGGPLCGCNRSRVLVGQQRGLVQQTHRQVVNEVDARCPVPAPLHVRGPTRQLCQVRLQVGDPVVLVDFERVERGQHCVVGALGGRGQGGPRRTGQGAILRGQRAPRVVEAVVAARHRPGGRAEEGRTPFRDLRVDVLGDARGALLGAGAVPA